MTTSTVEWEGRTTFGTYDPEPLFTWHDLPTMQTYGLRQYRDEMIGLIPVDAPRDELPFPVTPEFAREISWSEIGGLLMWNATRDEEGGTLVMFADQTAAQQRTVVWNGGCRASNGITYSEAGIGHPHWRKPDSVLTIDGDEWHVTYLSNDVELGR